MTTTKVKTSELVGAALDWAVAKAEGVTVRVLSADNPSELWQVQKQWRGDGPYWPSQDWAQGGPLIERHEITVRPVDGKWWAAHINDSSPSPCSYGLSPLIAACLAIVAAKLGDVVSVPSELLEQMK